MERHFDRNEFVAFWDYGNASSDVSNANSNTSCVFRTTEIPHPVTARNAKTNPSESFGQTSEFRGVVAARSGS